MDTVSIKLGKTSKFLCNKVLMTCMLLCNLLLLPLVTGCATTQGTPQVISMDEKLTVHLYDSATALRAAYMYQGGDLQKFERVLGFYSNRDNSIHCLKWDFYTCGHELFHALQHKGDTHLIVEKGFEHFGEEDYASTSH